MSFLRPILAVSPLGRGICPNNIRTCSALFESLIRLLNALEWNKEPIQSRYTFKATNLRSQTSYIILQQRQC